GVASPFGNRLSGSRLCRPKGGTVRGSMCVCVRHAQCNPFTPSPPRGSGKTLGCAGPKEAIQNRPPWNRTLEKESKLLGRSLGERTAADRSPGGSECLARWPRDSPGRHDRTPTALNHRAGIGGRIGFRSCRLAPTGSESYPTAAAESPTV